MKKSTLLALAISLLTLSLNAQPPAGAPAGAPAPPSIGRVYGKMTDSTGKGLADISVVVLKEVMDTVTKKPRQTLLKGVTTLANGDFSLEQLPIFTPLIVKYSGTGFQAKEQKLVIMPKGGGKPAGGAPQGGQMPDFSAMASAFEQDLGKITLQSDVQQLGAVTVSSSSGRLKMDIDKKVFNVDKNIVTAGGTALDVMRNVPSVNVDIDGNVSVRNAAPQIYVDGRPTTLTLDQIPADAIESVEIITNPSAKYDASGGNAGILNIILKKNKRVGYNGSVNAGVDKRGGLNGGGSFSLRQNKFNVTVAAFGNQMKQRSTNNTDITSFLSNPTLFVSQDGRNRMNGGFLFGRVGVDYFMNNRTSFSVGYVKVRGSFKPSDKLTTDSFYSATDYKSYSERNATNERVFNANGLQGGFKYLFPKQGMELTADVNYFAGKSDFEALYNTNVFANRNSTTPLSEIRQQILGDGENSFTTIQTDFVSPIGKGMKLETGLRAQLQSLENRQGNSFYNSSTGQFEPISSASANYTNQNNVYAAYLSLGGAVKDFGYKVGLRAESSTYTGELVGSSRVDLQACKLEYSIVSPK